MNLVQKMEHPTPEKCEVSPDCFPGTRNADGAECKFAFIACSGVGENTDVSENSTWIPPAPGPGLTLSTGQNGSPSLRNSS